MRDRSLIREIRLPRMRCSVLQCVAVCCGELPGILVSDARDTPLCCSVLQMLQCVAVRCSALQCAVWYMVRASPSLSDFGDMPFPCVATHVLQHM